MKCLVKHIEMYKVTLYKSVEPVLNDHPIGHNDVVSQDRWSLPTCSITLKCRTFYQKYLIFQDSHGSGLSRQVSLCNWSSSIKKTIYDEKCSKFVSTTYHFLKLDTKFNFGQHFILYITSLLFLCPTVDSTQLATWKHVFKSNFPKLKRFFLIVKGESEAIKVQ